MGKTKGVIMIILKWLWEKVSDKHHVFVTCSTLCLIVLFGFTVDVKNNKTIYEIGHSHFKRYITFNTESISNQTKMIVASRDESGAARELKEIKAKYWQHESKLYDLVAEDGEFKNQFHRVMWERRDDEIKKELDKFEKKLKGHTSEFEGRLMFAMRDR